MTTAETKKRKERKPRVGRPPKFQDVEELQRKIDAYFDSCHDENGKLIRPYTITGLALALDTSRKVLLDYESKDDEISNTIKKAKLRIENFAEEQLYTNKNTAGVIFNMVNNYGWVNRQESNVTAKVNMTYEEQLAELVSDD